MDAKERGNFRFTIAARADALRHTLKHTMLYSVSKDPSSARLWHASDAIINSLSLIGQAVLNGDNVEYAWLHDAAKLIQAGVSVDALPPAESNDDALARVALMLRLAESHAMDLLVLMNAHTQPNPEADPDFQAFSPAIYKALDEIRCLLDAHVMALQQAYGATHDAIAHDLDRAYWRLIGEKRVGELAVQQLTSLLCDAVGLSTEWAMPTK